MKQYEHKFQKFIEDNSLDAELVPFNTLVDHKDNVLEAIKGMNISLDDCIKTIIFYDQDKPLLEGNAVAAIVPAMARVDKTKVKELCKSRIKIAGSEEVLKLTGYPAGGVPPFGFQARFYMDKSLVNLVDPTNKKNVENNVYAGGGSAYALSKTKISEIIKSDSPIVEDIIEKVTK